MRRIGSGGGAQSMPSSGLRRRGGIVLALALALAVGMGAVLAAPATALQSAPAASVNDAQAFLTYNPPAKYQAVVSNGIQVPVGGNTYLSCDLYRPGTTTSAPAAGRFPGIVYQYHGYGFNRVNGDPPAAKGLAEQGYSALQCLTRGTGGSPGTFNPLSRQEAHDGYDIVEWLARQPWSNGRIGMTGGSYGGITTYLTAALRPPHLRAIVPQVAYEDLYRDIAHLGGVRGADVRGWLLALIEALNQQGTPPEQRVGIEQRAVALDQEWAAHPLYDAFWKGYAIDFPAIARSRIPVLALGGWYDIYQRGMPAAYQRLPREQSWLVMQNMSHIDIDHPNVNGPGSGPTLAFFDHFLKGSKTAPMPPTHVTSDEMPTGGLGWTSLASWPPPGVSSRLHLNAGGELGTAATDAASGMYVVDPTDGMPSYWNIGARPDSSHIVEWNTAREGQRLRFATAPLAKDLVLAGTPRVQVKAAFSATDGYLVARLSDVAPDGKVTQVSTGWRQASMSADYTRAVVVTPGKAQTYDIEVWPSHWRFAAGHRLQLSISSGDVPRIHPDAPPGTVTVSTGAGGSTLSLPTLQAAAAAVQPRGTGGVPPRPASAAAAGGSSPRLAATGVADTIPAAALGLVVLALLGLRMRRAIAAEVRSR